MACVKQEPYGPTGLKGGSPFGPSKGEWGRGWVVVVIRRLISALSKTVSYIPKAMEALAIDG